MVTNKKKYIEEAMMGLRNIKRYADVPTESISEALERLIKQENEKGLKPGHCFDDGEGAGMCLRHLIYRLSRPGPNLLRLFDKLGVKQSDVNLSTGGIRSVLLRLWDAGFTAEDFEDGFGVRLWPTISILKG